MYYLSQSLVHLRGGFLHGRLLNEGTCQFCVLSTDLVGCLLYERLQLFSLGLEGGREREREREGREREGGRKREGVILNKETMYAKPSRYLLV